MRKMLLLLCALCIVPVGGCDPRHGSTLGEFLDGRHVIEAVGSGGNAFLVWRRGDLAVERGDKILRFSGDFTDARKIYQFSAYGNEYAIIQCRQKAGIAHLLVVLTHDNMYGYDLHTPSMAPFATASSQGLFQLYQRDSASTQYRVWTIEGSDLYNAVFRNSPPGKSAKSRKSSKNRKSARPDNLEKKVSPKKQESIPVADIPDL